MSLLSAVLGRWRVQLGILAVLDVGDEVVQWLGACAHHKAGDEQVAPERRLSGAVGADGLQERDVQLGAQQEREASRHTPGDERLQPPAYLNRALALEDVVFLVVGRAAGQGPVPCVHALGRVWAELAAERLK